MIGQYPNQQVGRGRQAGQLLQLPLLLGTARASTATATATVPVQAVPTWHYYVHVPYLPTVTLRGCRLRELPICLGQLKTPGNRNKSHFDKSPSPIDDSCQFKDPTPFFQLRTLCYRHNSRRTHPRLPTQCHHTKTLACCCHGPIDALANDRTFTLDPGPHIVGSPTIPDLSNEPFHYVTFCSWRSFRACPYVASAPFQSLYPPPRITLANHGYFAQGAPPTRANLKVRPPQLDF